MVFLAAFVALPPYPQRLCLGDRLLDALRQEPLAKLVQDRFQVARLHVRRMGEVGNAQFADARNERLLADQTETVRFEPALVEGGNVHQLTATLGVGNLDVC